MPFLYKIVDDVDPFPVVTLQPSGTTVVVPTEGVFTSAGKGFPQPVPQWQLSTDDGSTWSNISGANSVNHTTPPTSYTDNNKQYRVVYSNSVGSVTSDAVVLDVQYTPFMVNQPSATTVNEGSTATFTASSNGNPTASIQWQVSTNGGSSWSNISGATSESYTTPATTYVYDQYQYRAVFTNSVGSVTSDAAVLTVLYIPVVVDTFDADPIGVTTTAGNTATFSVDSGSITANPSASVQWQVSTNNGASWSNISGATSVSYTTPTLTSGYNGYLYRAVWTNSQGSLNTQIAALRLDTTQAYATTSGGGNILYAHTGYLNGTDRYYRLHSFTDVGSSTITFTSGGVVDAVVVAGGGNGGASNWAGGGGGGGGTRILNDMAVGPVTYNVIVGDGACCGFRIVGGVSRFAGIESNGGGTGGSWSSEGGPASGGCGGGANAYGAGQGNIPATDPPQGYNGATGAGRSGGPAGGGGGSGQAGQGYNGGNGKVSDITGVETYYGGGGAGSGGTTGGLGGGGRNTAGTNGLGGGGSNKISNRGGSGVVLIRYEITSTEYYSENSIAPEILQDISDTLYSIGSTITFTSIAKGIPFPTVQWQLSTNNGVTWSNISGATSVTDPVSQDGTRTSTYTTPTLDSSYNGYAYRAVWTNNQGSATSFESTIAYETPPASTSGGTETYFHDTVNSKYYKIHSFTDVGSSSMSFSSAGVVTALIVAGGGGGGAYTWSGGGGGGGGTREIDNIIVGPITSNIINVGAAGGARANGGISSFGTSESNGGGKGGSWSSEGGAGSGGCGGGANAGAGGNGNIPATDPPQGYNGATGGNTSFTSCGGGGGSGQAGQGTNGGNGKTSSITGVETYYGGGGIGQGGTTGGLGGGGGPGSNGTDGLGGGGAGNWRNVSSTKRGGSGIVIVRYEISQAEYEANI